MISLRVLCASHVISPQRYLFLLNTIEQILHQTEPVDFYVSIYTNSPFPLNFPVHPRLHLYYQDRPLSQFEHFYFLAKLIDDPEHTFCLFCDDDDFSHRQRIATYLRANDVGQQSMLVRNGVLLMHDNDDKDDNTHTFEKCEEKRRKGDAEIVNGVEYFMYGVRAAQLLLFCQIVYRYGYLHLHICDLLFGSVLFFSQQKKLNLIMKNEKWVYAYSSRPKDRENEYQTYHHVIKNQSLLSTLRHTFSLPGEWQGKTLVYGEDDENIK